MNVALWRYLLSISIGTSSQNPSSATDSVSELLERTAGFLLFLRYFHF